MLKLMFQYFGHVMRRADSLEKTLVLGKIESKKTRGQQKMRCLDGITDMMDMSSSKLREMVKDRETWRGTVHGILQARPEYWSLSLLQGIFPTQGLNPGLPHCGQILYHLTTREVLVYLFK